jgi:hypothetical protein
MPSTAASHIRQTPTLRPNEKIDIHCILADLPSQHS